ncbi:MAG: VWA domain-containing protein, partial [Proteobacteria bacterium]|nr:VWA domain-containing protein [Pseudomonadota bacterium]
LLIDMSSSLKFGTFSGPKLERAAEVASVLAFNAIKNNDKVGVIFFTDRVEKYIPPKKGSSHIWRVIKEIFTFSPQGNGTNISQALDYLAKISKKRSFVFVLSDFLDDGYLKSLRTIRQRHEIIGVMIYDKGAFELPFNGIITLSDFETETQLVFDGFNKKIRKEFTAVKAAGYKKTLGIFSKAKSDVIELETSASVSDTLSKYFRFRERRLR